MQKIDSAHWMKTFDGYIRSKEQNDAHAISLNYLLRNEGLCIENALFCVTRMIQSIKSFKHENVDGCIRDYMITFLASTQDDEKNQISLRFIEKFIENKLIIKYSENYRNDIIVMVNAELYPVDEYTLK